MTKIGGYMNLKYSSDLPYPEIIVEENVQESKLLMPSYSGVASELTAILTYSFQSYITLQLPEIRDVIEGIAQTEMLHHELLGTTITKLGGFPVMGARSYWNGSFVNYTLDPKKFLKQNILAEENAIKNYERTILNLTSPSVKMLLERIILDEQVHIEDFKELLQTL
ncbi:MAG: manganese catalase family protein [Clostridia bacterium]|nr:manganese catalase family protein [Clostridia bacterium]